jgi:Tfp pilus assembly protein PilV
MMNIYSHKKIRGVTLVDALIAMAVGGIGLLALAIFQADLLSNSRESRTRSEAVSLAQQKMEQLRDMAEKDNFINTTGSPPVYVVGDTVVGGTTTVTRVNTSFDIATNISGLTGSVVSSADAGYLTATVSVTWDDFNGVADSVSLSSLIGWENPALSAARGDITHISQLVSVGAFAPSPTGGGRLAVDGELLLSNDPLVDNGDGTFIYTDGDGNFQLAADRMDGLGTIPLFVSSDPLILLSGEVSADDPTQALDIVRILTSDAGFCIYREGDNLYYGSDGSYYSSSDTDTLLEHSFNCYVSATFYGNLGAISKIGITQNCSAAIRYSSTCDILLNDYYDDYTDNDTCPYSGNSNNGIIGQLRLQDFKLSSGGCRTEAAGQVSIAGSISISGRTKVHFVKLESWDSESGALSGIQRNCTVTGPDGNRSGYNCVADENEYIMIHAYFDADAGASPGCTITIVDALTETRDITGTGTDCSP